VAADTSRTKAKEVSSFFIFCLRLNVSINLETILLNEITSVVSFVPKSDFGTNPSPI
jgi:hypothetical protein